MLRFLGTAAGIEEKSNQDLAGRQYGRLRVVSECRRYITIVSFEEPLLIAATKLSLSHWKLMWWWHSMCPQVIQVSMIGTISFAMIPTSDHSEGHCHWNHLEPRTAAHPHVPEASVWATKSGIVKRVGWRKMLKPFQDCRKMCHQNKSDLKALFSLVMNCSFLSFAVVKYNHETKVLPGLTTLVACCNVPTSDNISLFVAFFLGARLLSSLVSWRAYLLAIWSPYNMCRVWY